MPYKDVKKRFGLAIKNWRARSGISQEELAWRSDLHRSYIADIERGARNVSLQSIEKLASAFEVSLATLFTLAGDASEPAGKPSVPSECAQWVDVLLIASNPRAAALTVEAFRRAHVKNRIQVAPYGAAGLEYLFDGTTAETRRRPHARPQVILLDLSLPKNAAMQLLRRIKRDDRMRQIPVVVLAAAGEDAMIEESRRLGAEMHIRKPVDFRGIFTATLRLNWHWALFKAQDGSSKPHAK
jgi:CheY-like chemotaxis protein/DNA-binding XRE family transcriptional regulator